MVERKNSTKLLTQSKLMNFKKKKKKKKKKKNGGTACSAYEKNKRHILTFSSLLISKYYIRNKKIEY